VWNNWRQKVKGQLTRVQLKNGRETGVFNIGEETEYRSVAEKNARVCDAKRCEYMQQVLKTNV